MLRKIVLVVLAAAAVVGCSRQLPDDPGRPGHGHPGVRRGRARCLPPREAERSPHRMARTPRWHAARTSCSRPGTARRSPRRSRCWTPPGGSRWRRATTSTARASGLPTRSSWTPASRSASTAARSPPDTCRANAPSVAANQAGRNSSRSRRDPVHLGGRRLRHDLRRRHDRRGARQPGRIGARTQPGRRRPTAAAATPRNDERRAAQRERPPGRSRPARPPAGTTRLMNVQPAGGQVVAVVGRDDRVGLDPRSARCPTGPGAAGRCRARRARRRPSRPRRARPPSRATSRARTTHRRCATAATTMVTSSAGRDRPISAPAATAIANTNTTRAAKTTPRPPNPSKLRAGSVHGSIGARRSGRGRARRRAPRRSRRRAPGAAGRGTSGRATAPATRRAGSSRAPARGRRSARRAGPPR